MGATQLARLRGFLILVGDVWVVTVMSLGQWDRRSLLRTFRDACSSAKTRGAPPIRRTALPATNSKTLGQLSRNRVKLSATKLPCPPDLTRSRSCSRLIAPPVPFFAMSRATRSAVSR